MADGWKVNTSLEIKLEAFNHFNSILNLVCIPLVGASEFLWALPQVVSMLSNVSLSDVILEEQVHNVVWLLETEKAP